MGAWIRTSSLVLAVALGAALPVDATPTPIPGGANQVQAIPAALGQTVFNGVLRIKVLALRPATDADITAAGYSKSYLENGHPNSKAMYMETLLHNGAKNDFTSFVKYTVADKDAIAVDIPDNAVKNPLPHILQGAALKQSAVFMVDNDFTPAKLIITCGTCGDHSAFRAVRVQLAP